LNTLVKLAALWAKSGWRSVVSWAGLALCTIRAMGPLRDICHCKSIVVVQLGHFGDMVLTLPLLDAIRKSNPKARIRVITTSAGAAVANAFGEGNEVLVPNSRVGCVSAFYGADFIIHLRGGLWWVFGAFREYKAGFVHGLPHRSALRWAPLLLMGIPINRRAPEHQYVTLMRRMQKFGLRMPQHPVLDVETNARPADWPSDIGYIIVHAGGNWRPRRWSEEKFYHVCASLWQKYGLRAVIISAHETPGLSERLRMNAIPLHELPPATTILNLAAMIKGASLFLGNDSGPAHLAAFLGVPCVVLYGPQDPRLFGVLSEKRKIVKGNAYCSPCWQIDCPHRHVRCMDSISVDSVLFAISELVQSDKNTIMGDRK